ncbi:MAG: NAD(P)-binding domain-containing protein [Candidatus Pacearchaeota archaeon]|jgi:hypothetical protein
MKIGILGSGNVGKELAIGFLKLGHDVMIGTREINKLEDWLKKYENKIKVGSFEETSKFSEIIVLATLWTGTENAIKLAGINNFNNKIVIDVTNPLKFVKENSPPDFIASLGNSGGEQVQKWLDKSKVVKAFNMMSASTMCNPKKKEGIADLYIAGNEEGKKFVIDVAKKWGYKEIYDVGDISQSYYIETLAMLWIIIAFKNKHWSSAFKLLKE